MIIPLVHVRDYCMALLIALLTTSGYAQTHHSRHFNLDEEGLAIEGYDPVAYFEQNEAVEGKKEFNTKVDGVTYYFSSRANRDAFVKKPEQYRPQYGGWCAFAMGDNGEKVEVDPETFKIVDGKLYLFYNKYFNNTLKSWNKDESRLKSRADQNWNTIIK